LYSLFNNAAVDALKDNPQLINDATIKATLGILKKKGGATDLPNIYPQIQSEAQFFVPTYSNSNNAYKAGGSYMEAFPQAVSYPNNGWGRTGYFMLEAGGTFPPGMPQFTGMLPVMQAGSELSGIDSRAQQDMNHYYGTPFPMMTGGQPPLQAGGTPPTDNKNTFYTDRMQNFISKIQKNGQKAIMNAIETVDEMPPMSGMRYGGKPMYQANKYQGQVSIDDLTPGSLMLNPNDPNYARNVADYTGDYLFGNQPAAKPTVSTETPKAKSNSAASAGVTTTAAVESKPAKTASKPATKSSTSTSTTKARSTEELNAEVEAEKKKQESATSGTSGTSGTSDSSSSPAASGSTTTTSGTTGTTGWEGWTMQTLPDGTVIPIKDGVPYYQMPMYPGYPQSNPYYPSYPYYGQQPQQQNYGTFLDYIPGAGLRRKSANALLGAYLSGQNLADYEIDPTTIKTRRAILPGNRIKSFDLVKKGTSSGPITSNLQTEQAKTTQVPTIQPNVQGDINTNNVTSNYGTILPETVGPTVGAVPVVGLEGMRHGGPYALPMFQSDMYGAEITLDPNPVFDTYWNTGVADQLSQEARKIEKENDPFATEDQRLKLDFKRKGLFANVDPDLQIAGMNTLAGFINRFSEPRQQMTALDVYGANNAAVGRGSYVMNQPAVGLGFRPDQANANMRGMYAYDAPVAQFGGQGVYMGDTYYLTMPTIKNVKKAGALKLGK
jgi:hypothetical protein